MSPESLQKFRDRISHRDPHQPEFLQASEEVLDSLWPFISANPHYAQDALLERLIEPERIIQFRVCWVDDCGRTHVNRAFRVGLLRPQMSVGEFGDGKTQLDREPD